MAEKHNGELMAETERALLDSIKTLAAATSTNAGVLKDLAAAYSLIAANPQTKPGQGRNSKVTVM